MAATLVHGICTDVQAMNELISEKWYKDQCQKYSNPLTGLGNKVIFDLTVPAALYFYSYTQGEVSHQY